MKYLFKETLKHHEQHLLFQAHSHHCWPDIAYTAMNDYQFLVQTKLDDKWNEIFSSTIPRAQKIIAKLLSWPYANHISFAGSTHELLIRLFSAISKHNSPLRVLSTEFEYHSARRLLQNLKSIHAIELNAIQSPWQEITQSLTLELAKKSYDVCLLSQSFFHSGYTVAEKTIIELAKKYPDTFFVIDCYHSFAARELNFATERKNIALLGGGYKYAMSGEGCCFLALHPEAKIHEPIYNGWMAEFSAINKTSSSILSPAPQTQGYQRLLGATFDPIGLYRLVSVWNFLEAEKINPLKIKNHVKLMQKEFLSAIEPKYLPSFLLFNDHEQGNFLTLAFKNQVAAEEAVSLLKKRMIFTDSRDQYLRFGFGAYVDSADVLELACQLNNLKEVLQSKILLPV